MSDSRQQSGMSLARRLLIGAALWSLLVLIGGAFLLSAVYRTQSMRLLDDELDNTLRALSRAVEFEDNGTLAYKDEFLPSNELYQVPLSGRYWAIVEVDEQGGYAGDLRPQSLWDGPVPWPESQSKQVLADPGNVYRLNGEGPNDEPVRMAARSVILESGADPVLLVAAYDRRAADESAGRFTLLLVGAMGALAAGVLAAMWGGVRVALRPLARVEADIADIREGRQTRLTDDYPAEVRPLTRELNKLLDHNRDVVERAQTHVGNLAHALKTPLAVLRNEASADTPLDDVVRRQTEAMRTNVEHYLKRAQAAARAETLGARADVAPVVEGLVRLLEKLFRDRSVTLTDLPDGLVFRGEKQDLEEMLGNLLENACKYARSQVELTVSSGPLQTLVFTIDDDGPGLSPEDRQAALKRGVRLDETAPGSGLGLNIVTELAEMHSGGLALLDSPLGGLRAELTLPSA